MTDVIVVATAVAIDGTTPDATIIDEVRKAGDAYKAAVAAHDLARTALAAAMNAETDASIDKQAAKAAVEKLVGQVATVKATK